MLKFFHEDFDLQEVFPPLAGVRGWILDNFVLIHPPTPASGGENPCKPPNFVQKINALKFAKKNLTALPLEGVRGRISILYSFFEIQFLLMRQPQLGFLHRHHHRFRSWRITLLIILVNWH